MASQLSDEEIKRLKSLVLKLVPEDGRSVGNKTLRGNFLKKVQEETGLKLTDDDYWAVKNAVVADGLIGTGRGQGGSVYLVQPMAQKTEVVQKTERGESALYKPISEVVSQWFVKERRIDDDDFRLQITAHQGRRRTGGMWTRPDITLVAVHSYPFIPGKALELITFEVKPPTVDPMSGLFEAASHRAFAHRSYLVIHADALEADGEAGRRLVSEADRLGVGVITFKDVAAWDTYSIEVEADHQIPDPFELNSFVEQQLSESNKSWIQKNVR